MLLGRQGRHEGFKGSSGRRGGFKASLLPNVAFWNQKKISRKAQKLPGKRLAGGQRTCCLAAKGAMKGLKAAQGAGEGFKGSLLPNVAFWNQKKISRKAPGQWPKDMLLGRQGRQEGFKGSSGRRGGLRAAYCLTLLSETRRKSPGKRPAGGQRTCC